MNDVSNFGNSVYAEQYVNWLHRIKVISEKRDSK